jgi:hypothetical protein
VTRNRKSRTVQAAGRRRSGVAGQSIVADFTPAESSEAVSLRLSCRDVTVPRLASSRLITSKREPQFFSVADLAARWRCSRATVYGLLRGESVVDFAPAPGRKGHKLVPVETVERIERERMRVMR